MQELPELTPVQNSVITSDGSRPLAKQDRGREFNYVFFRVWILIFWVMKTELLARKFSV